MRSHRLACAALALALATCTNNPYPESDDGVRVRYQALPSAIKTLDPAVSYYAVEHAITAQVFDTLLEYHYLKRPYQLIPALAEAVPEPRPQPGGRVAYDFQLRPGLLFQDDPCFAAVGEGGPTREIVAGDFAFELMRIADPEVGSPVVTTFSKILGFDEFSTRLAELRERDPEFAARRIDRQYAAAGGIEGVVVEDPHRLTIVLREPYPQLLYWFAMPFTTAVPWEAVVWYDGDEGRDFFREHPVASGPYRIASIDMQSRIAMERNPNWYGVRYPEWRAPGAVYPSEGETGDAELGLLDPAYVGRTLPFLDRIDLRVEKEDIPAFNKFLQGYYDASGVIQESFDRVIHEGALSSDMRERGMSLLKTVDPTVFFIGFNMNDPVVGAPGGARARKLRQAMSLAVDVEEYTRIFANGRGVPAQSPIPPGIFGYDPGYENPFRQPDIARARELLLEAGYPGGIDPETGKPLHLTFDTGDPSTRARLGVQFFIDGWKQLGLDVENAATNSNRFREKTREGSYQILMYGWIADYPDPENFLFLLWSEMAAAKNPGSPNWANFADPEYDRLFLEMKDMPNGPRRLALIRRMLDILERERPWVELVHRESYALYHEWIENVKPTGISFPTGKYVDVDPGRRRELRERWNRPVTWPAWALATATLGLLIPGVVTFLRERQ